MIVQLLAGMFLGSIVASLVWFFFLKTVKEKNETVHRERDDLMHTLGELWIEVDSLITSFRSGKTGDKKFRETFSAKMDEINRHFRPNMHLFDVYYVKYIENLTDHYNRVARKISGSGDSAETPESDIEMETSFSIIERTDSGKRDAVEPESFVPPASTAVLENQSDLIDTISFETEVSAPVPVEESEPDSSLTDSVVTAENTGSGEKTELFERSPDSEPQNAAVAEDLFESTPETGKTVDTSVEEWTGESVTADGDFDVIIEEKKSDDEETIIGKGQKSPDEVAPAASVKENVEEGEQVPSGNISATVSAATDSDHGRVFDEEDFTMETMMDVDINTLSSFLKSDREKKPAADTSDATRDPASDTGDKTAELQSDLEIVIASDASHTEQALAEESVAQVLPEEPVFGTPVPKKEMVRDDDVIPEETTYTRTEELDRKTVASDEPQATAALAEDSFEVVFDVGSDTVSEQPAVAETSVTPVHESEVPVSEDAADQLFATELTDADTGDVVTGDDVADKIASLEFNAPPAAPAKPSSKKERKKRTVSTGKSEPAAVAKEPAGSNSKMPSRKSGGPAKKKNREEEAITGDDVAEKIDAFFGLFND